MKTKPAAPEPATPMTSGDVQSRIDAERDRLLIEQNLEADLANQRLAPLEAGDDVALDRVEAQINASRDRQHRIQERIELLEQRLVQTTEAEAQAYLDALRATADRARRLGEDLILKEYAQHATAIAAVLAKLAAIDDLIETTNRTLTRANRDDLISSPNNVRCQPGRTTLVMVTKTVSANEHGHPMFGKVNFTTHGRAYNPETKQEVFPVAIEVERRVWESSDWQRPLYEMKLPGIEPAEPGCIGRDLWDDYSRPDASVIDALADELKPNSKARSLSKVTA